jgi:ABC-type phosphate transport system substrate-binding protein
MRKFIIAVATLALLGGRVAHAQSFMLVVNVKNPVRELTRDQAARLFLKKSVTWSNGGVAEPVDQDKSSKAREAFSLRVLARSVDAVEMYWQAQIYSGRDVPPTVKRNDAEVLAFVAADARAIGYVAAGTTLPSDVRPVLISGS